MQMAQTSDPRTLHNATVRQHLQPEHLQPETTARHTVHSADRVAHSGDATQFTVKRAAYTRLLRTHIGYTVAASTSPSDPNLAARRATKLPAHGSPYGQISFDSTHQ
jgi:hypothetical protein